MHICRKHVLGLLAIAFLIRAYAAVNTAQTNSDEILYLLLSIGTITSPWHRLSTLFHGPVYFYMTDLAYMLLGHNFLAARFFQVLFSAFSVLLVYLISKEMFDKKISLIASAIFAFSAGQIFWGSFGLLDVLGTTISMLSILFLLKWHKTGDRNKLLLSFGIYAVAITTKISQLFLAPIFLLLIVHVLVQKKYVNKKDYLLAALVFVILILPVPAYNYLLFSDTGLADFHYARMFHLDTAIEYLSWLNIAGIEDQYFDLSYFKTISPHIISQFFTYFSIPLLLFFIIGLVKITEKRSITDFALLLWFFVPLLTYLFYVFHEYYLAVLVPPMSIMASVGLQTAGKYFNRLTTAKISVMLLLLILIAWEVAVLLPHISGKPATYQLQEYVRGLPPDSLVVMDETIWSGNTQIVREFSGKTVLFLSYFIRSQNKSLGEEEPLVMTDIYHVICVSGDCGWGTISEYTKSLSEKANELIRKNAEKVHEIYDGNKVEYAVYRMQLNAYPVEENYTRFVGYNIGQPERSIDVYELRGPFEFTLHNLALISLLANLLLALATPLIILALFLKEDVSVDL